MKIYHLDVLPTAAQITPVLKSYLLDYLKDYQTTHPEEMEELRILIGVLDLYEERTKDFLKYSGIEILNIIRQVYYYGNTIKEAQERKQRITIGGFIYQIYTGTNNAYIITRLRCRQTADRLEEIQTALTGIHGIDPERVRLENVKGNEAHRLSLIEKKDNLEAMLKEYNKTLTRAEQVRESIKAWFRSIAPEELRKKIEELGPYDIERAGLLLEPYEEEIIKYSKMDI